MHPKQAPYNKRNPPKHYHTTLSPTSSFHYSPSLIIYPLDNPARPTSGFHFPSFFQESPLTVGSAIIPII